MSCGGEDIYKNMYKLQKSRDLTTYVTDHGGNESPPPLYL